MPPCWIMLLMVWDFITFVTFSPWLLRILTLKLDPHLEIMSKFYQVGPHLETQMFRTLLRLEENERVLGNASLFEHWLLINKRNTSWVVFHDACWKMLLELEFLEKSASKFESFDSFARSSATIDCSLELQSTMPPYSLNTWPDTDLDVSASLAQSVDINL